LSSERERLGRVAKSLFAAEAPAQPRPTEPQPTQPASDTEIWREAVRIAEEEPRVTFVSSRVKAILVYLRKTVPDVSVSRIISQIAEDAVKQKYPELWQRLTQR